MIAVLLQYLQRGTYLVFAWYRGLVAALMIILLLARAGF